MAASRRRTGRDYLPTVQDEQAEDQAWQGQYILLPSNNNHQEQQPKGVLLSPYTLSPPTHLTNLAHVQVEFVMLNCHTHAVVSCDMLSKRRILPEVKQALYELFDSNIGPAQALRVHRVTNASQVNKSDR